MKTQIGILPVCCEGQCCAPPPSVITPELACFPPQSSHITAAQLATPSCFSAQPLLLAGLQIEAPLLPAAVLALLPFVPRLRFRHGRTTGCRSDYRGRHRAAKADVTSEWCIEFCLPCCRVRGHDHPDALRVELRWNHISHGPSHPTISSPRYGRRHTHSRAAPLLLRPWWPSIAIDAPDLWQQESTVDRSTSLRYYYFTLMLILSKIVTLQYMRLSF